MTETTRKAQQVTIYGEHVCYQFARTKMGKRTIKTTVRNIHNEYDELMEKEYEFGSVNWNGRENVKVKALVNGLRYWYTV